MNNLEPRAFIYANTTPLQDGSTTPEQHGTSLLTSETGEITPPEAATKTEQPTERQPGEISFYADGAGEPPVSYDPVLQNFFDGREIEARQGDDHERAEELATARAGLNEVLQDFQIGNNAAQEMFAEVNQYINYPRDDDYILQEKATTMEVLQKKWGANTSKMIAGAQRILREAEKKTPGLIKTMSETGAGNNPKIITHLANIAKKRGYA